MWCRRFMCVSSCFACRQILRAAVCVCVLWLAVSKLTRVMWPAVPQPPTITHQSPKEYIVDPRENIVIHCEAKGKPHPGWETDALLTNTLHLIKHCDQHQRHSTPTVTVLTWNTADEKTRLNLVSIFIQASTAYIEMLNYWNYYLWVLLVIIN